MTKSITPGSNTEYDALMLDARYRQSLATIRSLGRRGLRIAAADTTLATPAFSSRFCAGRFVIDEGGDHGDATTSFLEAFLETHRVRVVIPAADGTIEALRRTRERLGQRVAFALAKESALDCAVDKQKTLAIAQQLGLNVPRGVILDAVGGLPAALAAVGLPAVIKPTKSWMESGPGSQRVASELVMTPREAKEAVERLTSAGAPVILQQFLTGQRESVSFMYAGGTVYARFTQLALRCEPPLGGTSVLWQIREVPEDIGAQAESLIRTIDLEGFSEVEFRRDADGIPYLMEINPRLSATLDLAVRAGIDIPNLLYQWASGGTMEPVTNYRAGMWMRYLAGDLRATFDTIVKPHRPGQPTPARAVRDFATTFLRPMRYDYVDMRDPLPALRASWGFFTKSVSRYILGKPHG